MSRCPGGFPPCRPSAPLPRAPGQPAVRRGATHTNESSPQYTDVHLRSWKQQAQCPVCLTVLSQGFCPEAVSVEAPLCAFSSDL